MKNISKKMKETLSQINDILIDTNLSKDEIIEYITHKRNL